MIVYFVCFTNSFTNCFVLLEKMDWVKDEDGYTCIKNSFGETTFKYKSRINEMSCRRFDLNLIALDM